MDSELLLVLIPVYKKVDQLSDLEQLSIHNTVQKFKESHSIGLLKSNVLSLKSYNEYFNFDFIEFEFSFSTWSEYNSLLKSIDFYKKLNKYKFLLIVQTDAYVFSNDLSRFYQYDYVGAPWVRDSLKFIKGRVGNGGFSLRNIQNICTVLTTKKRIFSFYFLIHLNFKYYYKYGSMNRVKGIKKFTVIQIFKLIFKSIYHYLFLNSFEKSFHIESLMEDSFFGVLTPHSFNSFRVPDVETAVQFSIDENPSEFFELNRNKLPLGCHAFINNYSEFWCRFIY